MRVKKALLSSNTLFVIWSIVASFGAYFCMYAFRKPFNSGLYQGLELWGIGYKSVLILAQVAGYTLSKFAGIKVISELKASDRVKLIILLILVAEVALLFFGIVPYPYNFVFLFINGLPLGMVYGVVFSFLEGRRFTEMIALGLNISIIAASGILKTIYLEVHHWLPAIGEFWMPFLMGLLFLPFFLFFVWMLHVMPAPTKEDVLLRTEREPMTDADKKNALKEYGFPVLCILVCYALLIVGRDFRDNFTIEIWNEISVGWVSSVLSKTEMTTGFIVLIVVASLAFIKNNLIGFRMTNLVIFAGVIMSGVSSLLFEMHLISGLYWMMTIGTGMFLGFTVIQSALFDRMIALFRIRANAGFFVYMCESIGYLGSAGLLLFKEIFMKQLSWSKVLIQFTYLQAAVSLTLLICGNLYLERHRRKLKKKEKEKLLFVA
ncbi:DUF5690 family protein [Dyadobacter subterraneus]|uniref:MFS transporter n=1 Tax=Dyadobacter subterraneus TaxID=2773304 RepID=A0ABR9WA81_9BACT|nr:DUF5690 family protein [Dyadobacter subterraneus]MBE9462389.1 hypothetical protein [Dyadobacter subterraneus]